MANLTRRNFLPMLGWSAAGCLMAVEFLFAHKEKSPGTPPPAEVPCASHFCRYNKEGLCTSKAILNFHGK